MSSYFAPDAYCVFIPWTTMGQLGDVQYLDTLVFQSVDAVQQPQAIRQVREELARRLRFNPADERALSINDSVENTRAVAGITNGLKVVLAFIGVLTLAIGGVGTMNIMFVSVKERTREIGVRKALGARRGEILVQFLAEAAVLTSVGGILGIMIGAGIGISVNLATGFPVSLPWWAFAMGLGFSATVGIVAGMFPAVRASRLDPIEALRYE
jgi:putative ABC transport system permease protein